jgi:hypothetical protein
VRNATAGLLLPCVLLAGVLLSGCGGGDPPTSSDPSPTPLVTPTPESRLDVWPNVESSANSDPWLMANHARIRLLRPRVLALNFVNARSMAEMEAHFQALIAALREGSRYHGYQNPGAQPMLEYSIWKSIDMRDLPPAAGFPHRNSSRYPRNLRTASLDYGRFFSREYAEVYGVPHPSDGHLMDLCELVDAGIIHELWLYANDMGGDLDVSYAEVLELKPRYDAALWRVGTELDPCAGNGCFSPDDLAAVPPHCARMVRILWVNDSRGVGCGVENYDHGFESTAGGGLIPYLRGPFREFTDSNLDRRYGTPFESWYACDYAKDWSCISYTGLQSLNYDTGSARGSIRGYTPACGHTHVPPNGRGHYDYFGDNPTVTLSTCGHFRLRDGPGGRDLAERFDSGMFARFNGADSDCGLGWHVFWRQNFPGFDSRARADDGTPMLSWWPFLFY